MLVETEIISFVVRMDAGAVAAVSSFVAVEEMGALLGCEDGMFWLGLHEPDEAGASASYAEVRRRCDAQPTK